MPTEYAGAQIHHFGAGNSMPARQRQPTRLGGYLTGCCVSVERARIPALAQATGYGAVGFIGG